MSKLPTPRSGIPRPGSAQQSGMRSPIQRSSAIPGLRTPSTGLRPPGTELRSPSTQSPTDLLPPSARTISTGLRRPQTAGFRPSTAGFRPTTASTPMRPQTAGAMNASLGLRPPTAIRSFGTETQSIRPPTVARSTSTISAISRTTSPMQIAGPSGIPGYPVSTTTPPTKIRPTSGLRPPSAYRSPGNKEIQSKTTVTVREPAGPTSSVRSDKAIVSKTGAIPKTRLGSAIGARTSKDAVPIPAPSILRNQVNLQVKALAASAPTGSKVTAIGIKKTVAPPLEKIMTPSGPQQVLKKVITEKRVERTRQGETVSRNIKTVEMDSQTGETIQFEEELQKLNPDFPVHEGPVKQICAVVSEKDITESYETRRENIVQETLKLDTNLGINVEDVSKLVEEERQDIKNVLTLPPPELLNQSNELFPLKKRLQALKLTPEATVMLEKSLVNPPITADEPLVEPSPELMAIVMDTSDRGGMPVAPPEQIFNSLFQAEPKDDPVMEISSATPGPLGDVAVPTQIPETIHEEMLSKKMEEVSVVVEISTKKPPTDAFTKTQPSQPKRRPRRKRLYRPISEEEAPWGQEEMKSVIEVVGAHPARVLHPTNVLETSLNETLNEAVDNGFEYVLDATPVQYVSRVQFRGSQPPSWFPGYMYALSDTTQGVDLAKSPSEVLYHAWKSVQPEVFPDDSIVYN